MSSVSTSQLGLQGKPKTNGLRFKPPRPSPRFLAFLRLILPFIFDKPLRGFSVSIDDVSLERLRRIQKERCLLLPNHPAQWDPWVMGELSRQLNEYFYYVVAREIFDWHFGLMGWVLQRIGCFSVVRGASDKESFMMTKEILALNKGRLVVFVEGEISNRNDSLLPLEPGVVQLAFLALQDLYRQQSIKNIEALPSLYLCPISIRYFYDPHKVTDSINKGLRQLEEATGLDNMETLSTYDRIRRLSLKVLEETSSQMGYTLSYTQDLGSQIARLEDEMLSKLEYAVDLSSDPHLTYLDRVRRIRNAIDKVLKEHPDDPTEYQHRLHDHQKAVLKNFYWDLERIVNFVAVFDGYIHPNMEAERYIEVIRRLEKEVFGAYHLTHPRTAVVEVHEPINLKDRFAAFMQDKKRTSEELIEEIEQALYTGITTAKRPGLKMT